MSAEIAIERRATRHAVETATTGAVDGEDAIRRPPGRPPAEPEPRRRKIIAAAVDLFIEKGFVGTTIEQVARRSGLNKRTIYQLVGDKERLFREVCADVALQGGLDLSDAIDRGSLRGSLLSLAHRLLENSLAERTIALERTTIAASRRFPKLIDGIVAANYDDASRKVTDYFELLRALGLYAGRRTARIGELFYDVIVGQLAHRMALGQARSVPDRHYVEDRVDFFLAGLDAR